MLTLGRATLVLSTLITTTTSLLGVPDSPCAKHCGNVLSTTTIADIECFHNPAEYGTTAVGNVFQNCITCESTSTYYSGAQSDLQWLIYNMRYTVSSCLFNNPPNSKAVGDNPCKTARACEPLKEALSYANMSKTVDAYAFCNLWDSNRVANCTPCLAGGDFHVWSNFMVMLDAACLQLPPLGRTISVSGNPFTTNLITVTEPTPTGYVYTPESGPLNLGAKVGIAAAGIVLLLAVAGCGIVCNGKRRRRAFLRDLEKRHAHAQAHGQTRWPGNQGQGDMFETPVSTRPLFTGWDPSPVSAHTDGLSVGFSPAVEPGISGAGPSFTGRYFSPYSSQYSSPISAQETSAMMKWPSAAAAWNQGSLDKLAQLEREQMRIAAGGGLAPPPHPYEIGLALGGDDPSLRSKKSEQSFVSQDSKQSGDVFADQQQQQQRPYYIQEGQKIFYPPPPPGPPPSQRQQPTWSPDVKGKNRDFQLPPQQEDYMWSGVDVKGKKHRDDREEFELHEVDSNGSLRVPSAPNIAPVLQHPGFGRHPPPTTNAASRQQWV